MKYDEIMDYKYTGVRQHPRMTQSQRAAQFSPYAALTGYDKVIRNVVKMDEMRSRRVIDMTDIESAF